MTKISYKSSYLSGRYGDLCNESIDSWIFNAIASDGIEKSIKRSAKLLSLIAAEWLQKHPEMLNDIVYAIDCDGYNHKLVEDSDE
jgi:hypothetical protein